MTKKITSKVIQCFCQANVVLLLYLVYANSECRINGLLLYLISTNTCCVVEIKYYPIKQVCELSKEILHNNCGL